MLETTAVHKPSPTSIYAGMTELPALRTEDGQMSFQLYIVEDIYIYIYI